MGRRFESSRSDHLSAVAKADVPEVRMMEQFSNIFGQIPTGLDEEQFIALAETRDFKLDRIVSTGQATPDGEWYDQERAEWVVVLKGSAGLRFEARRMTVISPKGISSRSHRTGGIGWPGRTPMDLPYGWNCTLTSTVMGKPCGSANGTVRDIDMCG